MKAEASYKTVLPKGVESDCQGAASSPNPCCLELLSTCESVQGHTATAVPAACSLPKVTFLTRPTHSNGRSTEVGEHQLPAVVSAMPICPREHARKRSPGGRAHPLSRPTLAPGVNTLPPPHGLCVPGLNLFSLPAKGDCSARPPLRDGVRQPPVFLLARGPVLPWPSYVTAERESGCALL